MPVAVIVLGALVAFPAVIFAIVTLRIRAKNKLLDKFLWEVRDHLRGAGFEPVGDDIFRKGGRGAAISPRTSARSHASPRSRRRRCCRRMGR